MLYCKALCTQPPSLAECRATVEGRTSWWQCSQDELSAVKLKQMKATSRWWLTHKGGWRQGMAGCLPFWASHRVCIESGGSTSQPLTSPRALPNATLNLKRARRSQRNQRGTSLTYQNLGSNCLTHVFSLTTTYCTFLSTRFRDSLCLQGHSTRSRWLIAAAREGRILEEGTVHEQWDLQGLGRNLERC